MKYSWIEFLKLIPTVWKDCETLAIYLTDPTDTLVENIMICSEFNGCCTYYGENLQITRKELSVVTFEDIQYRCIKLSDLEVLSGEWGDGSCADFNNDPTEYQCVSEILEKMCPYDVHLSSLSKSLVRKEDLESMGYILRHCTDVF
jgi:hypothetical protein